MKLGGEGESRNQGNRTRSKHQGIKKRLRIQKRQNLKTNKQTPVVLEHNSLDF